MKATCAVVECAACTKKIECMACVDPAKEGMRARCLSGQCTLVETSGR